MAIRQAALRAAIFGVTFVASPALAQDESFLHDGNRVFLATTGSIEISLTDKVTGGCWPHPSATRDAVDLQFRNSAIKIVGDNDVASAGLSIYASGYNTNNLCVVALNLELTFYGVAVVPFSTPPANTFVALLIADKGVLMTGGKDEMQRRITDAAVESATAIILAMKRAREEIAREHPGYLESQPR